MTTTTTSAAEEQAEYAKAAEAGMNSDSNKAYESVQSIGTLLLAEFNQAEIAKRETEQRFLKDLRQYRGIYEPEVLARIGKVRSKTFTRATRVKVKTVNARVSDLLFSASSEERNWTCDPTPVTSLDKETKQKVMAILVKSLGKQPSKIEFEAACKKVAKQASDGMTKVMDDQLSEAKYKKVAREVLHSGHLYGTGILKAPLVERKTRTKFVKENNKWVMKTESYVVPFMEAVSIWRWYPDMSATTLEDCRYTYELHLFTRHALFSLSQKKSFDKKKILAYLEAYPKGQRETRYFDNEIRQIGDRTNSQHKDDGQYEVLERWGWLDGQQLSDAGVFVPPERMQETFFSNVWLFPNGEVIKIALQPINGVTWPYHLYYADKDETSIFADGFAAIMRDDQDTINAASRMVLDHAAITAGAQIEVNMDLLSNGEKADDMFPFKIWKRNGKNPGERAVNVITIPSGLEELLPIVNMFKENADDVTAIPRYMQGENATTGAAGTASGMSMLMANASIVMKDLITNYDEVTRTFIDSLYKWNMQFHPDNSIKGDFDVVARGTASLMAKEIRAQQLDQFAGATANELDAPYIKREELLRQRATAHDLSGVVKTEEEVQAEQNNPEAKQAQQEQEQFAKQMMQLQLQEAQLKVQAAQSEIDKNVADIARIKAITVKTNVDSAYAGMEAGNLATTRPEVAPAGDAILKSAGWADNTPNESTQQAVDEQIMQQQAAEPQQVLEQAAPEQIAPEQAAPVDDEDAQNEALLRAHMEGQDSDPLTPPSPFVGANVGERVGLSDGRF